MGQELSKIDKYLIYFLSLNCRMKLTKIAKFLNTSPARVKYHYNNLIKNNFFYKFLTLVDYRRLGFNAYSIYYRLKDQTEEEYEQIIEKIKKIPSVADILECEGVYNFHVTLLEKNMYNAAQNILLIRQILENLIIDEVILIYLRSELFDRKLFLELEKEQKLKHFKVSQRILIIDELEETIELNKEEEKLLAAIANNAELSIKELSQKTGLSPSKVATTLKRLEREKVIKGYIAKLNPNIENLEYFRVLVKLRNISPSKRNQFLDYLFSHPQIYRCLLTFGEYDLTYDARVKNIVELRKILSEVYSKFRNEIVKQDWIKIYKIIAYTFYIDEKN
ncbi:MAG: Lrp/AsnC family transcriptional regulator [Candidatus Micrarchaeota archaeon]|nr:Lrp/AsnC family transcriptional regulator [Candidatus Micrarchaeota archaeon]